MKKLLTILLLIASLQMQAKDYYFSSTTGSDLRTSTEAQNIGTPWQSINKLNAIFSTLAPGDHVYFKRGDVFYGNVIVTKNGNTGAPITFSAYGSGERPVISGFSYITSWTNVGTNLWRASVPGVSVVQMVVINNNVARMGRTPNYGFWKYESHNGNLSFTDNELINSPNYKKAYGVFKNLHDQASKVKIKEHIGATIFYDSINGYRPIDGAGWFVEGALSTVDTANEWYMDEAVRQITVYSIGAPTNVKVATKDTIFAINQFDNITIDGLAIEGSNQYGVSAGNPKTGQSINPTIKNSSINYSGINGIYMTWDLGALITGNTITNSLNSGIELENEGGQSDNATVTRNTIKKSGMIIGMGLKYNAAVVWGANLLFQYNDIDSAGLTGISAYYNNVKILNNRINHYCMTVDDAGAINFFDPTFGGTTHTGREIGYNTILNGTYGAGAGTVDGDAVTIAIYIDDKAKNILVYGNSISNVPRAGFYIHNGTNISFTNNTVFNAGEAQMMFVHDNHAVGQPLRGIVVKKNLLFAKTGSQLITQIRTRQNDIAAIFNPMDSNQYARPSLTTGTIIKTTTLYGVTGSKDSSYTKTTWTDRQDYDQHTNETAPNAGTPVFYENWSDTVRRIYFPGLKMIDAYGTNYDHQATIEPWLSKVLTPNGSVTNLPPHAGIASIADITQPVSQVTLTSTSTDPDGAISTNTWYTTGGTITNAAAASTTLTGLAPGQYQVKLVVTDNLGAKDSAFVNFNVIASAPPNIPPTVSATVADSLMILPTNSTTTTATAIDTDGTIGSYKWIKKSGPATFTIASDATASTGISNLVQGTYIFEVTAKDNTGDSAKATVKITVFPAPVNIPPIAFAGNDTLIYSPVTTVTLYGSSTDQNGSIASWAWTLTSGPMGSSFGTPAAATTTLDGLVEGVYKARLTVTDNDGATAFKEVTISVAAASKIILIRMKP